MTSLDVGKAPSGFRGWEVRYNSKEWGCPETVIDYSTLIFLAV